MDYSKVKKATDDSVVDILLGEYDISEIPGNLTEGWLEVLCSEVKFDCYFHKYNESKKLYVFLDNGRQIGKVCFNRWSWYPFLDGSMLNIDDPMYVQYPTIMASWYYGTNDINYRPLVCDIVSEFVKIYGFEEIVFYGSSAGGTCAIACACMMPNTQAIAINPQIKLSIDINAANFEKTSGMKLSEDKLRRDELVQQIKESKSIFLITSNIYSERDQIHKRYLFGQYGLECPDEEFVQLDDNLLLWNTKSDSGNQKKNHIAMDIPIICRVLIRLSDKLHKNEVNEELIEEYHLFAYLWNEIAQLSSGRYKRVIDESYVENMLKAFIESSDDTYILGAGIWGKTLFSRCDSLGIKVSGFSVSDEYVEETKKASNVEVKALSDLDPHSDCLIISTTKTALFKEINERKLRSLALPEWYFRQISGT